MTTRYRVEYALKTHRRDQFIEWIKKTAESRQGLLAVPFVLHTQPTSGLEGDAKVERMAETTHRRYAEIMQDVENLISDHIAHQQAGASHRSKLKLLVPSIGGFFTPLMLRDAFVHEDSRRYISFRRFVAPSFNDIRVILNTAQVMSLVRYGPVELITFDGDLTLYDDGESLTHDNPVISRILALMQRGTKIGIVTAAGYTDAQKYYERLFGLLDAIATAPMPENFKRNLVVMGGESNFLFLCNPSSPHKLEHVSRARWELDQMRAWDEADINALLDIAQGALRDCVDNMRLDASILRKPRAVGIVPNNAGRRLAREQLEETVLVTQNTIEMSAVGNKIPFCAFNGGNDIFVDIGDKSLGVLACQRFFGGITGDKTLHVGDQFLSVGANDFKARLACTTAWIAGPAETVALLDDILELAGKNDADSANGAKLSS